jgi:hypothetical protein
MDSHESSMRSLLVEIVKRGDFPTASFELRHIEKIENFTTTEDGKARFTIERHPHIFGRETLRGPSLGYIPTWYTYEIDSENEAVSCISKKEGEPFLNYIALAIEDVSCYWEWCDTSEEKKQFRKLKKEEDVLKYAEKRLKELNFSMEAYDLPISIEDEFSDAIKKEFITEMVSQWKICLGLDAGFL